jgi:hypothetical protein
MEIFYFTTKLHDSCGELSQEIRFDKKNLYDLTVISHYGSLIEFVGALIGLINQKMGTAVPTVFRTYLETYVDSVLLLDDPSYLDNLKLSMHKEWLKLLKAARSGNRFLREYKDHFDLDKEIEETQRQMDELKDSGVQIINIHDKFKKAGMEDAYPSVYNRLCTESHSNLSALAGRHVETDDEDHQVVYYKDRSLDDFLPILDTVCGTLIVATENIHNHFKTDKTSEIGTLKKELEEIRSHYEL